MSTLESSAGAVSRSLLVLILTSYRNQAYLILLLIASNLVSPEFELGGDLVILENRSGRILYRNAGYF